MLVPGGHAGKVGLREHRLADATRADQRDQSMIAECAIEDTQVAVAADEATCVEARFRYGTCHRWCRFARRRNRQYARCGCSGPVDAFDARREAIAAARNRRDQLAAEHLAQGTDLRLQVVLLDDHIGPDEIHQLVFGNEAAGALDQRDQHVECARAERCGRAIDQQSPLVGLQLETTETQSRVRQLHNARYTRWCNRSLAGRITTRYGNAAARPSAEGRGAPKIARRLARLRSGEPAAHRCPRCRACCVGAAPAPCAVNRSRPRSAAAPARACTRRRRIRA